MNKQNSQPQIDLNMTLVIFATGFLAIIYLLIQH